MDRAVASPVPVPASTFRDGLGERRRVVQAAGDTIELLCLRRELTAVPSFEFALRERTSRLAGFRHESFTRVRSIDRLSEPSAALGVVSEFTRGVRLSHLLTPNEKRPISIDINAAQCLIRQILDAVAALHEGARDLAHGAIAPERILVTSNARAVIVEGVLGAALEQLRYSPERYWKELRVALPPASAAGGPVKFDHRADVTQIGVVALSLVLGRRLRDDEEPSRLGNVLTSAEAIVPRGGGREPLSPALRDWIARALQLDSRPFASAVEARAAFEEVPLAAAAPMPARSSEAMTSPPAQEPVRVAGYPTGMLERKAAAAVEAPEPAIAAPIDRRAAHRTAAAIAASPSLERTTGAPEPGRRLQLAPPTPAAVIAPVATSFDLAVDTARSDPGATTRWWRVAIGAAGAVGLVAAGIYAAPRWSAPAPHATTGTLRLTSNPSGAQVFVDRQSKGDTTPVTLTLRPGPHNIELRGIGEPRTVDVTIAAGTETSQSLDLTGSAATVVPGPSMRADSAGTLANVDVAGRARAAAPANGLTAVSAPPPAGSPAAPVSGWVSVSAPVEVEIREHGAVLGTSHSDRIMVAAGRHQLEIANETLGFTATSVVQVPPGRVAPVRLEWPKGTASINAEPWAEVSIDGEKVGDTPIGNLSLPIGPHEIVFRHPELGEQRQAVSISLKSPARISVDMRRQP